MAERKVIVLTNVDKVDNMFNSIQHVNLRLSVMAVHVKLTQLTTLVV